MVYLFVEVIRMLGNNGELRIVLFVMEIFWWPLVDGTRVRLSPWKAYTAIACEAHWSIELCAIVIWRPIPDSIQYGYPGAIRTASPQFFRKVFPVIVPWLALMVTPRLRVEPNVHFVIEKWSPFFVTAESAAPKWIVARIRGSVNVVVRLSSWTRNRTVIW